MAHYIENLTVETFEMYLDGLVSLLIDAVEGGASVNFVSPFTAEMALKFWQQTRDAVKSGDKIVLMALQDGHVAGTVQLSLAWQPNGQHRAEVQKLLVHRDFRRQGIARALMTEVERIAREQGRFTLVLDTEKDSIAEDMYARFGYQRVGEIPNFALNTQGEMTSTIIFYKLLT